MLSALLPAMLLLAADPPAASDLLRRAFEVETSLEATRSRYLFHEHAERRSAGRDGRPGKLSFTHDYEWVYLEGAPYRKRVAINGKPLQGKRAAEEERRFQQTAAERKAEAARRKPDRRVHALCETAPADILSEAGQALVREEEVGGRKTWVVESQPKPDTRLAYRFVHWIDQQDGVIVQDECTVVREGADLKPGSRWRRVNAGRRFGLAAPEPGDRVVLAGWRSLVPIPHIRRVSPVRFGDDSDL